MNIKNKMKKLAAFLAAMAIATGSALSAVSCAADGAADESSTPTESSTPAESGTPAESEPEEEGSNLPDFDFMAEDLTQFVTLGEYKNMTIEVEPMTVIDDGLVMSQINYDLISGEFYEKVTDRAVTEDDIVSISYKGLLDGEEFDGGTGTKDMFTIFDGGGFIEGFAEGIIGAMPGVETAVELNFPEDYYEDLAGKPVTFMVTVSHIYEAKELTNEVAVEFTGNKDMTAEALVADYKTRMEESAKTLYEEHKLDLIWQRIFANATEIELPAELVKSYYEVDVEYYTTYATMYGVTYEQILEMIGMTDDDIYNRAHDNVFTDMVVYSVVKAEGITLTEDEYDKYLTDIAASSGYGKDAISEAYGREALEDMFLYTKVYEDAVNWQTYTVVENKG